MSIIPPTSQCPADRCHVVVNVCWADSSGNVAGCHTVPVDYFAGKGMTLSMADIVQISGAIAFMMATAWLMRYVINFLHYQGR